MCSCITHSWALGGDALCSMEQPNRGQSHLTSAAAKTIKWPAADLLWSALSPLHAVASLQVAKLKAFSKFENTTEALQAAASLVDSKISKGAHTAGRLEPLALVL